MPLTLADIYLTDDAQTVLKNKYVVFIGDSGKFNSIIGLKTN